MNFFMATRVPHNPDVNNRKQKRTRRRPARAVKSECGNVERRGGEFERRAFPERIDLVRADRRTKRGFVLIYVVRS